MNSIFFIITVFVVTLANASVRNVEFSPGKTYVYKYQSHFLTGIPKISRQYAGGVLNADVVLNCLQNGLVSMKLKNVNFSSLNQIVSDVENVNVTSTRESLQDKLSQELHLFYNKGRITKLKADASESQWSLNIKKAVLSLLNIDLNPESIRSHRQNLRPIINEELTYYTVYEDSITGLCETLYHVKQMPYLKDKYSKEAVLNVTKVINHANCAENFVVSNVNLQRQGCDSYCKFKQSPTWQSKNYDILNGYYVVDETSKEETFQQKYLCDCNLVNLHMPVDQFTIIKYNISLDENVIESIHSDGQIILDKEVEKLSLTTVQRLDLKTVTTSTKSPVQSIKNSQEHNSLAFKIESNDEINQDIPYYQLFKLDKLQEVPKTSIKLIKSLTEDILKGRDLKSQQTMEKILKIVDLLATLKESQLSQVFDTFTKHTDEETMEKEQLARQVFLNVIGLVGTNDAAKLVNEAVSQSQVSIDEAISLLEALTNNMYKPEKQTIDKYVELLENERIREKKTLLTTVIMTVGKLIKKGCSETKINEGVYGDYYAKPSHPKFSTSSEGNIKERHRREFCSEEDIERYLKKLGKLLSETNEFTEKAAYLASIANTGVIQSLQILEPYLSGKISEHKCSNYVTSSTSKLEKCDYLRTLVMYSLHHIVSAYPKEIRALTLPVYFDVSESPEVRMAALTLVMFSKPQKRELQAITNQLRHESNRQILLLTYSYLQNFAKLGKNSRYQDFAENLEEILHSTKEYDLLVHFPWSKVILNEFYSEEQNAGLFWNGQYIRTNYSQLPESLYFSLGKTTKKSHSNVVSFAYLQRGLENFLQKLQSELASKLSGKISEWKDLLSQYLAEEDVKEQSEGSMKLVNKLKEKFASELPESSNLRLKFSYRLFDNAGFHLYDEKLLRSELERLSMTALSSYKKLLNGQKVHLVKIFMPSSYNKMVISDTGLPVLIRHRNPLLLSLKISQDKELNNKNVVAFRLEPLVSSLTVVEVNTLSLLQDKIIGSRSTRQTHFSLPCSVALRLNSTKQIITLSFTPHKSRDILTDEVNPVTYVKELCLNEDEVYINNKFEEKPLRTFRKPHRLTRSVKDEFTNVGVDIEEEYDTITRDEDRWLFPYNMNYLLEKLNCLLTSNIRYRNISVGLSSHKRSPIDIDVSLQYRRFTMSTKSEDKEKMKNVENDVDIDDDEHATSWLCECDDLDENSKNYTDLERYTKIDKMMKKVSLDKSIIEKNMRKLIQVTSKYYKAHNDLVVTQLVKVHNLAVSISANGYKIDRIGLNFVFAQTLDKLTKWFKLDGYFDQEKESPSFNIYSYLNTHSHDGRVKFCSQAILSYPQIINELAQDTPILENDRNALFKGKLTWGDDCLSENKVQVSGLFESTHKDEVFEDETYDEDIDYDRENEKYSFIKNSKERKHFNKYTFDIKYNNVPSRIMNITKKIEDVVKATFWWNMDVNDVQVSNEKDHIKIVLKHSDMFDTPVFNVYLEKPTERTEFKHVMFKSEWLNDFLRMKTINNGYKTCSLINQTLTTFDDVQFRLPKINHNCEYLLFMDCRYNSYFVLVSKDHNVNSFAIILTVISNGKVIRILPEKYRKFIKVTVNNKEWEISLDHPELLIDNVKIAIKPIPDFNVQVFVQVYDQIEIITNGIDVQLRTNSHHIAYDKTCGICGNNAFRPEQKLVGPNKCEYQRIDDFVHSYVVPDDKCKVPKIKGNVVCPQRTNKPQQNQRVYLTSSLSSPANCETRRNYSVRKGTYICFTKKPLKSCGNCSPVSTEVKNVEVICYSAHDAYTKQLENESAIRELVELRNAFSSLSLNFTVPLSCAPY